MITFDPTRHDDHDHQDLGKNLARIFSPTGISHPCHPDPPEDHPALPENHPDDPDDDPENHRGFQEYGAEHCQCSRMGLQ